MLRPRPLAASLPFSLPPAASLLLVTLAYFVTASLVLAAFGESTPIWYSNAIVIVALLRQPPRTWLAFIAAAGLADALAILAFGHGVVVWAALADMLEIVLVAGMVQLTGGVHEPLFERGQVARVFLACLLGPLASATLGAAVISPVFAIPFQDAWRTWYSASALGLLIVAPLLLCWLDRQLRARAFEGVSRPGALLLAGGALAAALLVQIGNPQAALFFTFPILFALTWAFGLLGASLGMAAVTLSALWATLTGSGAIVTIVYPLTSMADRIEALQMYLAAVLLSSLPLALLHAQQRELTARLRRASEARTEFLAAMSHEIRTPMTGVLGMVDLLAAEPLTGHQQRYVQAMRSSGQHLVSVINDILDFSRIESGRLELEEVDFPLREVTERVRSLAHPLAVERGLDLRVEEQIEPQQVVRGDPLRLRQVLLNLVSNAIKFTESGSVTIGVGLRPNGTGKGLLVRFQVRDTGIGIEPAQLQQLFTPFTQADRSISRQYGGSGLGLAISKRLVDAMGGSITASGSPGGGSVFTFEVPLRRGDPQAVVAEAHQEPAGVPPQRILVAEDVKVNREILRAALERQGHHLSFASDGAEALAQVQAQEFDLVLMDVQMPVMDGVEATRRIRQLPLPQGQVPIIGLTANVMARERERYLGAGMDDCLGKPVDWDALHAALARIAGRGRRVAAPAPQGVPAAALVDEGAVAALRRMASEAELAVLMDVGMSGYEAACAAIEDPQASADTVGRQAHKLKGSAGTLGLAAISTLAARIEAAAGQGGTARELVPQLRPVIAATREELVRRGLLGTG